MKRIFCFMLFFILSVFISCSSSDEHSIFIQIKNNTHLAGNVATMIDKISINNDIKMWNDEESNIWPGYSRTFTLLKTDNDGSQEYRSFIIEISGFEESTEDSVEWAAVTIDVNIGEVNTVIYSISYDGTSTSENYIFN